MSDTKKRLVVIANLARNDLLLLGKAFGLPMSPRLPADELRKVLETSGRAQVHAILPELPDASLAKLGKALGLGEGLARDALIAAIREAAGDAPAPPPKAPAEAVQMFSTGGTKAQAAAPDDAHADAELPAPGPLAPDARKAVDLALTVEVEARKPRLAWQGMERRERAVPVPTQVVEVVRAGRAVDRGDSLLNTEARAASAGKAAHTLPPNRLIWTNDNLVALTTLLNERDPVTKDYKYQGKVDLIYIDPPFMVNSNFRAENSIDIDIDGVQATKEPSLVEILAYKDTWRQGLDSFLTMLRTRLELLKKLLAPTGSIYVHLDWHAVHYVKVMMDEVFAYENFQNEIVWKRTSARAGTAGINHIHDVILSYGATTRPYVATVHTEYDAE
jgi:adenine-specific DNA-methyltransferase